MFLDKLRNCEYMIAVRFHSAILSDIFKIPFIPVAYSNKMRNLMKDRDFKGEVINLDDLNLSFDTTKIVAKFINNQGVFNDFLESKGTATRHFYEFEKILNNKI